jgi:hypothetical protein
MTLSVGPLTQTSEPPGPNLLTCDASAVPRLLLVTKSDAADQLGISLRTIEGRSPAVSCRWCMWRVPPEYVSATWKHLCSVLRRTPDPEA